ncbi:hypothetical protein [Streptomyces mirabilis]|uniref:hypothetical protein n=1 Tax=Streptomyces mirabilis TaxID=68239 RepID=UPI0036DB5B78
MVPTAVAATAALKKTLRVTPIWTPPRWSVPPSELTLVLAVALGGTIGSVQVFQTWNSEI